MTTRERLQHILVKEYDLSPDRLVYDARLDELGIDSLGLMELLFKIEDELRITVPMERTDLQTLGDVVKYVDTLVASQHSAQASGGRR